MNDPMILDLLTPCADGEAPTHAGRTLGRAVQRALEESPGGPSLRRVAVEVEGVDPLAWLAAQTAYPKLYWAGREDGRRVAAVGAALSVAPGVPDDPAFRALLDRIAGTDIRLFGGFRFDPAYPAPGAAWAAFGSGRFVLPRFELVEEEGRTQLICNLVRPEDDGRREALAEALATLRPARRLDADLPLPLGREDAPGFADWRVSVERALDAFDRDLLQKVVLARRATFTFDQRVVPEALLSRLEAATPACFHFMFALDPSAAFVGASPERLYRRTGRDVTSEAVAGTRPRGASADADARLRAELLGSEKERREHAVVLRRIEGALQPLTRTLDVDDDPSALTLARGRHLYAGVRGTLCPSVTDADLLSALSPTPAVGGDPREEALEAIRAREPFDRGWYAGPVGWVGADAAEFAVAIRSGLVSQDRLALYSGAGIVRGSTPAMEWNEIEHKISDFTAVLGLEPPRAE